MVEGDTRHAYTLTTSEARSYDYFNAIRLLAAFGEVEITETSTRGTEGLSLSNSAVFPTLLWTGKHWETSKLPRFTKCSQEYD